jgi:2-C-methyl-D-erythritol 4-phosphate cytidylyltransferase
MKVTVLLVAAGSSRRLAAKKRKPFIKLANKFILDYSLEVFLKSKQINEIIIAVNELDLNIVKKICLKYKSKKAIKIIGGGKERADSVFNALLAADKTSNYVLVHDAARPFVTLQIVSKVVASAKRYKAAVAAVKVTSTVKSSNKDNFVTATINRSNLWEIQTPQVFEKSLLFKAYKARSSRKEYTDDASLVEAIGKKVKIVATEKTNIKITTSEDILLAKSIIKMRK